MNSFCLFISQPFFLFKFTKIFLKCCLIPKKYIYKDKRLKYCILLFNLLKILLKISRFYSIFEIFKRKIKGQRIAK